MFQKGLVSAKQWLTRVPLNDMFKKRLDGNDDGFIMDGIDDLSST